MTRQQRRHRERQQAKRNAGAIAETPVKTAVLWAFSPHSWRAAPAAPEPAPAIAIDCNRPDVRQSDRLHDTEPDGGAGVDTKRCTSCKESKPLHAFSKDKSNKDGLQSDCRSCKKLDAAYYRTKRAENKRSPRAEKKQAPSRPPEKICEGCRTSHEYRHYKKDPDGLFGISDYCVLCSTIMAVIKGELTPDPYPDLRGAGVIENYQDEEHDDDEYEEKPRRRKHL